jgi:hypothetical protein
MLSALLRPLSVLFKTQAPSISAACIEDFFPDAVSAETDLDLISLRDQAGHKARITKVTRATFNTNPLAWRPIGVMREAQFKADLALVLSVARPLTARAFSLYRAESGRPMHITLTNEDNEPAPVLFSARSATYAAYFSHIASKQLGTLVDTLRFDEQIQRVCLRMLADHLINRGKTREAFACFFSAWEPDSHNIATRTWMAAPPGRASLWDETRSPHFYFPLIYFALAHELGHHSRLDISAGISEHPAYSVGALTKELLSVGRRFEVGFREAHARESSMNAKANYPDVIDFISSNAADWAVGLRSELLADLVGVRIIWSACVEASRREWSEKPDVITFCHEITLALTYLMLSQIVAYEGAAQRPHGISVIRFLGYSLVRLASLIDAMYLYPSILAMPELSARRKKRFLRESKSVSEVATYFLRSIQSGVSVPPLDDNALRSFLSRAAHCTNWISLDTWAFWDVVEDYQLWDTVPEFKHELFEIRDVRRKQLPIRERSGLL